MTDSREPTPFAEPPAHPWRRRLRWRMEVLACQFLAAGLWQLGHRRALAVGETVGRLLGHLVPRRLGIATDHLRRVFGESKTEAEIEALARQSLATLGGTFAELLWLRRATRADVDALVEISPGARLALKDLLVRRRGSVLVGIHFGRWELMFLGFNLSDQRLSIVVRPLENPYLDAYVTRIRCRFGNSVVHTGHPRAMHTVLATGGTLLIAMDHRGEGRQAAVVEFLGQVTSLRTGIARLARRYEAPVLPIYPLPLPDGRLRIETGPLLDTPPSSDKTHDVVQIMQCCADVFDAVIRQYPQYWSWSHKRLWGPPAKR